MNTKTQTNQTLKQIMWASALVLLAGFAAGTATAAEPTPAIQAQGQTAIAAIQAELRASLPRAGRSVETSDDVADARAAVRSAIVRQRDHALRTIAWENEAQLHIHSRVAADARPSRGELVTVSAPMYFGAIDADGT
ncbi:MAG: hypothetical protein ABR565_00160 [Gammaproteobacteria bacterium]